MTYYYSASNTVSFVQTLYTLASQMTSNKSVQTSLTSPNYTFIPVTGSVMAVWLAVVMLF